MADSPRYSWNAGARRYRGPDGRFIPESQVRDAVDVVLDVGRQRVVGLTRQLQSGAIQLDDWMVGMQREMKTLHTAATAAANGGWDRVSQSSWGFTGHRQRDQLTYLRNWAEELRNGPAPLDGRLLSRAELYAEAARGTFEEQRRRLAQQSGQEYERWVRHAKDSCRGCETQAERGQVPIGTLPEIGSQDCRTRCKCTKAFADRRAA